ncbi:hypothetical protein [Marinobacter orientalis]|uniref:Uncharacterized protein n=1 Tax=Marinobacter orientalis TaxID=1928859 RepID=A0A7Y0REZ9_9GAMM|nr:hypothetical protein [Marinobacter orientalis]NMT65031.1 hypothetical protein [Marinobacter orientalis]TGX49020.1 hypothetical protein DIT72_13500 [Marinobacter orientalis]
MKIEKFLYEADRQLSAKLEEDLNSNEYSEQDAHNAIVLARIDTALILAASSYNSKLLSSINIGVWGIFAVLVLHVVMRFF